MDEMLKAKLEELLSNFILCRVLPSSYVPEHLKYLMFGPNVENVYYVFVFPDEIEFRILTGTAGLDKYYEMVDKLESLLGTKIIISFGTMRKRRNVICSSSWKYWNKNSKNAKGVK